MQRVAMIGGGFVYLRELRGEDEDYVTSTETASAIALVDRLLVAIPGVAHRPGEACRMTAADRDRVLAAVYERDIARHIRSTPMCEKCGKPFDLDIELSAIVRSLEPDRVALASLQCRLPTGEDELLAAAEAAPEEALAVRCGVAASDAATTMATIERAAPLIDLELEAACPDCKNVHLLHFDIQTFLLGSLIAERRRRTIEVHQLARTLGWSLTEILSLSRSQRRLHAELADRDVLA